MSRWPFCRNETTKRRFHILLWHYTRDKKGSLNFTQARILRNSSRDICRGARIANTIAVFRQGPKVKFSSVSPRLIVAPAH